MMSKWTKFWFALASAVAVVPLSVALILMAIGVGPEKFERNMKRILAALEAAKAEAEAEMAAQRAG